MDRQRRQYLEAMGVELWERRAPAAALADPREGDRSVAPPSPAVGAPIAVPAANATVDRLDWEALRARVADCRACGLHAGRTQTVFGVGDPGAQWLFIGEAPGADEDRQGEPFVGRAGQLLNAMLQAMGLERSACYIANILKCRPPGNRDPRPEEVAACEPYLQRQVALIRPRIVVALGRIAAQNLLRTEANLARLRGQVHRWGTQGVPLIVTYHPAYLLRSPAAKRQAWEDLKLALRTFDELRAADHGGAER